MSSGRMNMPTMQAPTEGFVLIPALCHAQVDDELLVGTGALQPEI